MTQASRRLSLCSSIVVTTLALVLLSLPAAGQDEVEIEPSPWIDGPATVTLGDDVATVKLPAGYRFADGETTRMLMEAMGNPSSNQEAGLIAPADENRNWFIIFEYDPVGYVEDDDKAEIDAAALLETISEATENANEYRRQAGHGELHVTGWYEQPNYDDASHNLQWALEAVDDQGGQIVNYNVRLLGRSGYMSVTLVTEPHLLTQDKPEVETVLANFGYVEGNRYGDFMSGDKLAGYGLTALIAGGAGAAAAKLGLFAVLGKFLAKAWKLVVVGIVALGAALKRIFGGLFGRQKSYQETL